MPRGKTFTGCWTCRNRRVKCDEARPDCNRCLTKGIPCDGYECRFHWLRPISSQNLAECLISSDNGLQRRRLLPVSKIQPLTSDQIDRFLSAVDESSCHDRQRAYGPFSVFQTNAGQVAVDADHGQSDGETTPGDLEDTMLTLQAQSATGYLGTSVTEDEPVIYGLTVNTSDRMGSGTHLIDPCSYARAMDMPLGTSSALDPFQTPRLPVDLSDTQEITTRADATVQDRAEFLNRQTKFLLKHYRTKVVCFFSVLDNPRTPWRVLHLPKAMQAACEIEINETPGGAPNILLHAILATSAYTLQNLKQVHWDQQSSQHWEAVAIHHKGEALRLLTAQLNPSVSEMTESEYQELLAAILSMVSIDVICGDTRTCRLHLRACEALIRTRTTVSGYKLSSLSKALHTTFIYLRVMQMAAGIDGFDARPQNPTPKVSTASTTDALDLLTDNDFAAFIDPDGANSICLDSFSSEMIYGFPAELLFLLNRTVEIVVRMNTCTQNDSEVTTQLLWDRDQLENSILDWPVEDTIDKFRKAPLSPGNHEVMIHYTQAFHQALIIFFYNKIHRTRARLLQQYAQSVISHLEQVETAKARYRILAGPLLWPAFVAGRQATNIVDQKRIISWLEESDNIGIGTSKATIERLHKFWTTTRPSSQHQAAVAESDIELVLT